MTSRAAIGPIDPPVVGNVALTGRVVTMGSAADVRESATVWIANSRIQAITAPGDPVPVGFAGVKPLATKGTIYPGLIDLHNHLPYNVLPLWQVPKRYTNRDQWGSGSNPQYRPLISGPMGILGRPEYLPAVVRYVEVKALLGGSTTTQGIKLFSDIHGGQRYYRGVVRNVEQTDEPDLPEGATRIADVDADLIVAFDKLIRKPKKLLLHLSEGTDDTARNHFLALKLPVEVAQAEGRVWALSPSLVGIHCAALKTPDFAAMGTAGASMVWSPMSNLLLYGATSDVATARDHGLPIGLGPDWSPSGSKNLLGEMKAAFALSRLDRPDAFVSPFEIVSMVTTNAAHMIGWGEQVGRLQPGFLADLIVVNGATGDPFEHLLRAAETDLSLVMINGVARYGLSALVSARTNAPASESIKVGGAARRLNLAHVTADPAIGAITLAQARSVLTATMLDLPQLEHAPVTPAVARAVARAGGPAPTGGPQWRLALDELVDTGQVLRTRFRYRNRRTAPRLDEWVGASRAATPLPLRPLTLDPLTVADDDSFLDRLGAQTNLPAGFAAALAALYV